MKRGDLLRYLQQCGCTLEREGPPLDLLEPVTGKKTSVPRHTEIDNRLARKICKHIGVSPIN